MNRLKLDDINKKHPFSVPDGYFDKLSAEILEKKSSLDKKRSWVWSPAMRLATVASFVAVIVITFVINLSNQGNVYDEYLAEVSNEDIIAYLADTDITELDLLEMVDENVTIEFELEDETLDDIEFGDEALDDIYLDYGIDELNEI